MHQNLKVGFTGTRHGMTGPQQFSLESVIKRLAPEEFHHGSCQGADVQAARLTRMLCNRCRIVCHPGPDGDTHRQDSGVDDEVLPPNGHFARNRDIVATCDVLLACPCEWSHQPRGETWYTVDYARKCGKHLIIVWPDGTTSEE